MPARWQTQRQREKERNKEGKETKRERQILRQIEIKKNQAGYTATRWS